MSFRPRSRQVSLFTALFFLCVAPDCVAAAQPANPAFAVSTVRPAPQADPSTGTWSPPDIGRFAATHVSLAILMQLAYGVDDSQIANKPGWLESNLYDIVAKPEDGVRLSREELKPRLQDLLLQRFHLHAHMEIRNGRGYALTINKGGPHLTPTKGEHFAGYRIAVVSGQMRGENWSMPIFAKYLTSAAGFPVVDQTGLTGSYDIAFSYAPDSEVESSLPSLSTAVKLATGLLLKSQLVPVETVVIDSVSSVPTQN